MFFWVAEKTTESTLHSLITPADRSTEGVSAKCLKYVYYLVLLDTAEPTEDASFTAAVQLSV